MSGPDKPPARENTPGWYSWTVLVGAQILGVALTIVVMLNLLDRAVTAERQARLSAQQETDRQREQGRRITCALVIAQDNVFREEPPTTPAGLKAAKAWHDLRQQFQCDKE